MVKGKAEFLRKYGHLRPGTYEITSPNYRDNFKNYFHNKKYRIIILMIPGTCYYI